MYLGHIVSANGITPDLQKVVAVVQFPHPKPYRQFLGLMNYYHKFVYNYASVAEPFHGAHKKFKCVSTYL